jgi:hypothetical protein
MSGPSASSQRRRNRALWDSLAWLGVMSRTWTERHGAEAPAHSGDLEPYTLDHANGSGPFRLESFALASVSS